MQWKRKHGNLMLYHHNFAGQCWASILFYSRMWTSLVCWYRLDYIRRSTHVHIRQSLKKRNNYDGIFIICVLLGESITSTSELSFSSKEYSEASAATQLEHPYWMSLRCLFINWTQFSWKKESYWDQVDGAAMWVLLMFEPIIAAIPENQRV